ncbi:anthranilate synthase component 1 [Kroppenstedtia sanguinis]|uniref:anthranilate synthase component I family protein n=1 Tax=Kroppenstedtia sanguinis TaxID=1380684 RepID=UPI003D21C445
MYTPTLDEVRAYAPRFSTIPICKTVFADLETPISLHRRLGERPYSFLLESAENKGRRGRYSFIGADPLLVFQSTGHQVTITEKGRERTFATEDPFQVVKELLQKYRSPRYLGYPPFLGGAVGYVGYDAVALQEPTLLRKEPPRSRDLHLMFCDRLIIVDHLRQEWIWVIHLHVNPEMTPEMLDRAYEETLAELDRWMEEVLSREPSFTPLPIAEAVGEVDFDRDPMISNLSKEEYCDRVLRGLEAIRQGDLFQVVPSQRWEWRNPPPAPEVYRVLRLLNPSPYMYCLTLGDEAVVGASPELLVRVSDGKIETRPIAGTRPRGRDEAEDAALAAELLKDEKERAEHDMLVDLSRQDLGKVSKSGSVQVTEAMTVERYSHVMHLVSHVTGELREGVDPLEGFQACFPAGTVSGAPKNRALAKIAELEEESRGVYAGAIGYFSFNGSLDSCITIRTIHFQKDSALIQAGAGVVDGSVPEREYEESRNKARGLIRALALTEGLFKPMGR